MPQIVPPLLRVSLGGVACFHALRFLGAFSGSTASEGLADLASKVGGAGLQQPTVVAWIAVIGMALSGIGLVLGAFTRAAACLFFGVCLVGLALRPPVWEVGSISDVDRLGIELLLVLMVQCVAVFNLGPGSFSIDLSRARAASAQGA